MLRDAASGLPVEESRVFYLAKLGKLQVEAGFIDEALKTAADITGFTNHGWLIRQIALIQAGNGDFDMSRETLRLIDGKVALVLGYAGVAVIAVAADKRDLAEGLVGEGLAISHAMPAGRDRDNAIGRVAWYRAEASDHNRAVELLAETRRPISVTG